MQTSNNNEVVDMRRHNNEVEDRQDIVKQQQADKTQKQQADRTQHFEVSRCTFDILPHSVVSHLVHVPSLCHIELRNSISSDGSSISVLQCQVRFLLEKSFPFHHHTLLFSHLSLVRHQLTPKRVFWLSCCKDRLFKNFKHSMEYAQ